MNKFRFEAIVSEFPFLRELGATPECDSIQVKRWDEAVLAIVPNEYSYDGSLVNDWREDTWHAILPDGEIKRDFVKASSHYHSNYAHSQDRNECGETLLEALHDLDESEYLVRHEVEHDDERGRPYRDSDWWTIYKPARQVTIAGLCKEALQRAKRDVAAELDF